MHFNTAGKAGVALGATTLLAIMGCSTGSSGGSGSTAGQPAGMSSSTATNSSASCDLTQINATLQQYSQVTPYKDSGPTFDISKVKGKTIFNIQESSANPFTQAITTSMKAAAAKVGMKVIDYPNQGQHTQWIQAMNTAIAQKVDAITLTGGTISPTYFKPQAAAAKAAGIPIITVVNEDLTQQQGPDATARVAQPYAEAAKLSVDYALKDTNCNVDALVLTSKEVIGSPASIDAVNSEFAKYCPKCKVSFQNISVPDWSTQISGIVRSAIQADSSINYVIPLYDSMSQFAVPGIQLAGSTGKVHIATFNGTPFVLKMIQDGDTVRMDIGENPAQVGYATIDQVGRVLTGAGPIASGDENIPLRIFTKANVNEAGTPPMLGKGYASDFESGYLKLWGLSS